MSLYHIPGRIFQIFCEENGDRNIGMIQQKHIENKTRGVLRGTCIAACLFMIIFSVIILAGNMMKSTDVKTGGVNTETESESALSLRGETSAVNECLQYEREDVSEAVAELSDDDHARAEERMLHFVDLYRNIVDRVRNGVLSPVVATTKTFAEDAEEQSGVTKREEPVSEEATTAPEKQNADDEIIYPICFTDESLTLTIAKEWYVGAWCYIAHIQLSDYSRFKTGIADGGYGSVETVSSFYKTHDTLLAVNGDYAEGCSFGVIRDGIVYKDGLCTAQAIYSQRTGVFSGKQDDATLSGLAAQGYTDTFEFAAVPLVEGWISVYGRKDGGKSAQRTLLGYTEVPGEIFLVVTEGRYSDGESRGLQYYEAGDLLEAIGCKRGIALDGGGSSEMIWRGKILNHVTERKVTGFVYIR